MKGNNRVWVLLAITFQIGVVAAMVLDREWLLADGEPHLFQTAPIDPRDIFRGDYVRLSYSFSDVPISQLDSAIREQGLRRGQKVYLSLTPGDHGTTQGGRLSSAPPEPPYLQGYVTRHWPSRNYRKLKPEQQRKQWNSAIPVRVKYGIERYYVEQGSGLEIEQRRGERDSFQTPMLIHAALSRDGEAAISGYEWANIAIKTEIVQSPEPDVPEDRASATLRLTLKNLSDQPLILPLKEDNCSFELVLTQNAPQDAATFVDRAGDCASKAVQPVRLPAGETLALTFDLNRLRWWVRHKEKPTPLGKLPWQYRYRLQYRGEAIEGINAVIRSSAFHGRGNID